MLRDTKDSRKIKINPRIVVSKKDVCNKQFLVSNDYAISLYVFIFNYERLVTLIWHTHDVFVSIQEHCSMSFQIEWNRCATFCLKGSIFWKTDYLKSWNKTILKRSGWNTLLDKIRETSFSYCQVEHKQDKLGVIMRLWPQTLWKLFEIWAITSRPIALEQELPKWCPRAPGRPQGPSACSNIKRIVRSSQKIS